MRCHVATLFVSLLVNVVYVASKELPAIVTYTVSPAEVSVVRKGNARSAIDSDSLTSELIQVDLHPTRTRSDAGRSRRTDDVTVATSFDREGGEGDAEENVKILQNYAVTNFNNNLSTPRSTTESVIELLDRLRNLPPEESGGHLEALGSGTERAETDGDALQLLNEWREHVRVMIDGGQTKDSTISTSMEDTTTTPSFLMDVMELVTATQDSYNTTEESNSSGNKNDTSLETYGVFTTDTITNTTSTANTETSSTTVAATTDNIGLEYVTSQAPITNDETSSAEESIASSTGSMDIGTTNFDETTSNDTGEFVTTPLPTTSANNNDNILIPNVPLVAVGGGIIKDSESANDKDESGAAFWDSRVEIAVVSAAAVLLCLVAAAALITYCVCRSHFHRKNIYTTMEVEPRPQFFTKPGPPVILRHEVEERRRGVPQSHTPGFEERERQKVTEL